MTVVSSRLRSFVGAWWIEITTIAPNTAGPWPAVRVSVSVTVPLAALLAVGHPDWAGYAVFGSLSSVYGKQYGYPDRLRAQLGVGAALTVAVLLGIVTGIPGPGSIWSLAAMSAMSLLGFLITRSLGWLPVPSLFLVFATGTISASQHAWGNLVPAFVVVAGAALFGVLVGQTGRLFHSVRTTAIPAPHRTSLRAVFAAPGARRNMTQYTVAPFAAGLAATALSLGHPYWAAVSATVPIVGTTAEAQLGRATLRIVGTALGIGLAAVLILMQPPLWVLVLEVATIQVITELFVSRNYGIAVLSITPLALILSHLADPVPVAGLVFDRLLDTVLGVVVAVLVLALGRLPAPRRVGQ